MEDQGGGGLDEGCFLKGCHPHPDKSPRHPQNLRWCHLGPRGRVNRDTGYRIQDESLHRGSPKPGERPVGTEGPRDTWNLSGLSRTFYQRGPRKTI